MSFFGKLDLLLIASLALYACGKSAASGTATAAVIGSPQAGVSCFSISDGDGKVVGGNCLKD